MIDDLDRLRTEYSERATRLAHDETYRYSPLNPASLYLLQQRERVTLELLRQHGLNLLRQRSILEIGCGNGDVLLEYIKNGAEPALVTGADLLSERVMNARERLPGTLITCADAQTLPYRDQQFDMVLQYIVFSSVLDDVVKARIAREMLRVVKQNGLIIWYDFWINPTNTQTKGIRPAEIRWLFPDCRYSFRRITLAPPITRLLIRFSWLFCEIVEKLKILNSHYLVVISPSGN